MMMEKSGNSSKKRPAVNNNKSPEFSSSSNKEVDGRWDMTKQGEDMVFTRKDLSPGTYFTVPISNLASLKTGELLPTGNKHFILQKTNSGYSMLLRKV